MLVSFAAALAAIRDSRPHGRGCDHCALKGAAYPDDPTLEDRSGGSRPHGRDSLGAPTKSTCAVRALHLYIDTAGIRSGVVFRKIDQVGRVSPSGLHKDSIGRLVKTIAARAGLKNIAAISGHSLRSGCVTQAARNGVPTYLIKRQTGHKSSKMLDRYIRLGEMFTRNAASCLGL